MLAFLLITCWKMGNNPVNMQKQSTAEIFINIRIHNVFSSAMYASQKIFWKRFINALKSPLLPFPKQCTTKKTRKRTPQNKKKPACNRRKSPTVSRFLCFYVFIPPARRVLESESKKFHKRHRFYRQCKPECFPDTVAVSGSRETYDEQ